MGKKIWFGLGVAATLAAAGGFSLMVWAGPGSAPDNDDQGATAQPTHLLPGGRRFLGHLSVKGSHKDLKNLMTSIVVHPKLWEPMPYVLFDEPGFGHKYSHDDPMSIKLDEIRAESVWDAQTAAHFWSHRPVHVMVDTEGWAPQYDATLPKVKKQTPEAVFNRQALRVHLLIQSGIEEGWPQIIRFGWWSKIVDIEIERKWKLGQSALETNLQVAPLWRRVSYFAPRVYQFMRLVESGGNADAYEADADAWAKPFQDIVQATIDLRDAIGGEQLILPCMWGTTMVGRPGYGKGNDRWNGQFSTENERRLMVRTVYEAGADGILVWQPIRDEAERDEFQRAIGHIEEELAQINGDSDLGPIATLGELFRIRSDWPGRPMDWMRKFEWGPAQPIAPRPIGR